MQNQPTLNASVFYNQPKYYRAVTTVWMSSSSRSATSAASSDSQWVTSALVASAVLPGKFLQQPKLLETSLGVTGSRSMPLAMLYSQVLQFNKHTVHIFSSKGSTFARYFRKFDGKADLTKKISALQEQSKECTKLKSLGCLFIHER